MLSRLTHSCNYSFIEQSIWRSKLDLHPTTENSQWIKAMYVDAMFAKECFCLYWFCTACSANSVGPWGSVLKASSHTQHLPRTPEDAVYSRECCHFAFLASAKWHDHWTMHPFGCIQGKRSEMALLFAALFLAYNCF